MIFNFEFVEEFAHILAGDDQCLGQAHGCRAGYLALRGRGLDFRFQFFSAHVLSLWILKVKYIRPGRRRNRGRHYGCPEKLRQALPAKTRQAAAGPGIRQVGEVLGDPVIGLEDRHLRRWSGPWPRPPPPPSPAFPGGHALGQDFLQDRHRGGHLRRHLFKLGVLGQEQVAEQHRVPVEKGEELPDHGGQLVLQRPELLVQTV